MLKKKLYQHRPQIAWKGISDFLQFVPSRSDDTSNDTLRDSPLLDLQTSDPHTHQKITPPTPCVTTGLRSANPDPYTHQTTPPTTPCVTAPPRNESTKSANPNKNPYIAKAIWGNITEFGTKSLSNFVCLLADVEAHAFCICGSEPKKLHKFRTALPGQLHPAIERLP